MTALTIPETELLKDPKQLSSDKFIKSDREYTVYVAVDHDHDVLLLKTPDYIPLKLDGRLVQTMLEKLGVKKSTASKFKNHLIDMASVHNSRELLLVSGHLDFPVVSDQIQFYQEMKAVINEGTLSEKDIIDIFKIHPLKEKLAESIKYQGLMRQAVNQGYMDLCFEIYEIHNKVHPSKAQDIKKYNFNFEIVKTKDLKKVQKYVNTLSSRGKDKEDLIRDIIWASATLGEFEIFDHYYKFLDNKPLDSNLTSNILGTGNFEITKYFLKKLDWTNTLDGQYLAHEAVLRYCLKDDNSLLEYLKSENKLDTQYFPFKTSGNTKVHEVKQLLTGLLEYGFDINAKNSAETDSISLVHRQAEALPTNFAREYRKGPEVLLRHAIKNKLAWLRILEELGADLSIPNKHGKSTWEITGLNKDEFYEALNHPVIIAHTNGPQEEQKAA